MPAEQILENKAVGILQKLLGRVPASLQLVHGGGNNRVYRVKQPDLGPDLALKLYAPPGTNREDGLARLQREFHGLHFLRAGGFRSVPSAIAADWQDLAALYEWIEGTRPALLDPQDRSPGDIGAVIQFAGDLHRLSHDTKKIEAGFTYQAREACLSGAELLHQIDRRIEALGRLSAEAELQAFLADSFHPIFDAAAARLRAWGAASGISLSADLATECRILSPSDFGFHNALRQPDGRLIFIDFEYFGWDDPVKLLADFVWHPAMHLSPAERLAFLGTNLTLFGRTDPQIVGRLHAQLPLYGLRWAAILLNEFFPDRWQRRVFAGKGEGGAEGWELAKLRQLQRARHYLHMVQATSKTAIEVPTAHLTELLHINQ
ncbi:phosphotransferase [Dongia sp.]|uniref:phosphotransferase n=1 Tax=Dongia sp. TaxID=1977262 RepID=UPI0035B33550